MHLHHLSLFSATCLLAVEPSSTTNIQTPCNLATCSDYYRLLHMLWRKLSCVGGIASSLQHQWENGINERNNTNLDQHICAFVALIFPVQKVENFHHYATLEILRKYTCLTWILWKCILLWYNRSLKYCIIKFTKKDAIFLIHTTHLVQWYQRFLPSWYVRRPSVA